MEFCVVNGIILENMTPEAALKAFDQGEAVRKGPGGELATREEIEKAIEDNHHHAEASAQIVTEEAKA